MKIENKEQTILGLYANFDHDPSMHVHTGAKNVASATHSIDILPRHCTVLLGSILLGFLQLASMGGRRKGNERGLVWQS